MSIISILRKLRGKWHLPPHTLRWYPSERSCSSSTNSSRKPSFTPPLMVRRADWRR